MIKIIIADDSDIKANKICSIKDDIDFIGDDIFFERTYNAYDLINNLRKGSFDLLILDLNIPLRRDASPDPEGGLKIMKTIGNRSDIIRPTHIIGLTEFDELIEKQETEFRRPLWNLIKFDIKTNEWVEQLKVKINHIKLSKIKNVENGEVDIAIINALAGTELESVLSLDGKWQNFNISNDETLYYKGFFKCNDGRELKVIASAAEDMGMPASTALSMKLIYNFKPKYLVMTGIAAGLKGKQNYGDILIADSSWDYGSGKTRYAPSEGTTFTPAPRYEYLRDDIKTKLTLFSKKQEVLDKIKREYNEEKPSNPLKAYIGAIASGAAVLEDVRIVEKIKENSNRKLIGIEMETYGVFIASTTSSPFKPIAISIKSVCDFADTEKNDKYQKFAAYTSANFFYQFAINEL